MKNFKLFNWRMLLGTCEKMSYRNVFFFFFINTYARVPRGFKLELAGTNYKKIFNCGRACQEKFAQNLETNWKKLARAT